MESFGYMVVGLEQWGQGQMDPNSIVITVLPLSRKSPYHSKHGVMARNKIWKSFGT